MAILEPAPPGALPPATHPALCPATREQCAPPGRRLFTRTVVAVVASVGMAVGTVACGGDDDGGGSDSDFVEQIPAAVAAVEAELGEGQEFFEVTATPQLTNIFVAVDDGTGAVPYVFVDGELGPPAPTLDVASGFTFDAHAIDFDPATILAEIADAVPDSTIESLSLVGVDGGTVRYTASVRSSAGGLLDVTVGPDGAVLEVDPV